MRIGWVILCAGMGSSMAAQAEDMKTLAGQIYSNVVVKSYDRDGYSIRHDGGTNLVPYSEISAELRGHYKALSLAPIPASRLAGEKEAPAGPDDLETLAGQIYRNVILKKVGEDAILIAHDTGMATVSFAAIPRDQHEKYRTAQAVPDPEPGANDLVTAYGQIFRHVEITREEPDGLTFRHDGGVTKVGFPALPEDVRQKYKYDPVAGWQYRRDQAAQKTRAEQEAAAAAAEPGPPAEPARTRTGSSVRFAACSAATNCRPACTWPTGTTRALWWSIPRPACATPSSSAWCSPGWCCCCSCAASRSPSSR